MSVKKTLSITGGQQLVDLNGETTNFDLTFTAKSVDNSHFDVLVVDQTTLDSNPTLEFKRAKGIISGNIISDKNVYQNYFLCLKAEKPCTVEVTINKTEIQPKPIQKPQQMQIAQSVSNNLPINSPSKPGNTNWKLIFIVIVILGASGIFYYMYNKKKQQTITINNPVVPSLLPLPPLSLLSSVQVPLESSFASSLAERIANLKT